MHSKNANPLTEEDKLELLGFLHANPNAQLRDVAAYMGIGVPGLKQRALKAGYILRSRLCLDPLFPERNVDK